MNTLASKRDAEKDRLAYEAKHRAAELAVITSVQKALADEFDIQKIYDTVGEKVREIFEVGAVTINVYDLKANTNSYVYGFESGKRTRIITLPISKMHHYVLKAAKPTFLLNTGAAQFFKRFGAKAPQGKLPKSALSIKLGGKSKQITAVVLMDIEKENAFSQNDVRLLQALANSMQVALENARLFDETKQRNAELAVITGIQNALAKELDLNSIYRTVGQQILGIFKTQTVTIRSFDVKKNISYFDYSYERNKEWFIKPYSTSGMMKYLIKQGGSFLLNEDFLQFLRKHKSVIPAGQAPKSFIFVPFARKDGKLGAITIEDMDREHAFANSDVRLLETIAKSMQVALDNARLFAEVQKRNQEITDALEQQTATSDILRAMASSPSDLDPVLVSVAKNAAKLCEANDVQIYSVDGNRLKQVAHWGPLPALKDGDSLPLVKGLVAGRAVLEKKTIHTKDASKLSKRQYPESVKLQKRLGHRTVVATPLLHQGKAIGLIAVRRNEVRPFTDKQIALLATFADQAAIAIENVRLLDETTKRNAELAVINSVQQGLASRLKFQEIIDLVGEKVGQIFKADTVSAGIYDAKRDWAINSYYVDRGRRLPLPDRPLPRPSLSAKVIDTRKPLLLGTVAEQEAVGVHSLAPAEGEEDQNQSVIFVPILAGKRAIGVISVQRYEANAYQENDLYLLETLAGNMSVALENARLFDETAQRNAELAVINSVQQAMAKQLDIKGIYEVVGEKIKDIFDAQSVLLTTLNDSSSLIVPQYIYEKGERFYPEPWPITGLAKYLVDKQETVVINQDFDAASEKFGMKTVAGTENTKSGVFVPLVAGGKTIGGISLQNIDRENAFSESDVRLLETLANSMSVALENARLFDETAQRNAELAVINSVQEGISSKLDVQAIYELVGEKLRQVFQNTDVTVGIYDSKTDIATGVYIIENGVRLNVPSFKVDGIGFLGAMIRNPRTLVINENMEAAMNEYGSYVIEGTGSFKSMVDVPLIVRGDVVGLLRLQHMNKEHAFSDADVRLLETIAKSVSIALENARLFDETAQRNAELAVINSVQSALAKELNIQAIYEAVGNKIREIFDAQGVILFIYDSVTNMLNTPYIFE
ncbi:MAG TPA: GAF domain-containing protein, partial [Terriglobales bacterium]|nr:GAF domain-containing protein [Terriglobales bacterium]